MLILKINGFNRRWCLGLIIFPLAQSNPQYVAKEPIIFLLVAEEKATKTQACVFHHLIYLRSSFCDIGKTKPTDKIINSSKSMEEKMI